MILSGSNLNKNVYRSATAILETNILSKIDETKFNFANLPKTLNSPNQDRTHKPKMILTQEYNRIEQLYKEEQYEECTSYCLNLQAKHRHPYIGGCKINMSLIRLERYIEASGTQRYITSSLGFWLPILVTYRDHSYEKKIYDLYDVAVDFINMMIHNGKIIIQFPNSFICCRFSVEYIKNDITLFRYHDDRNPYGNIASYMTNQKFDTREVAREKLSILPEWNDVEFRTEIIVRAPTLVIVGETDSGTTQYVISKKTPITRVAVVDLDD